MKDDDWASFRFDKEREQWVPVAGGEEEESMMLLPIEGEDGALTSLRLPTQRASSRSTISDLLGGDSNSQHRN